MSGNSLFQPKPLVAALSLALCHVAVAQQSTTPTLREVQVTDTRITALEAAQQVSSYQLAARRAATSDSASLFSDVPGVNVYSAGGVSSLPVIRGLADDRLRIKIDGMDLIASCPNHMNSPLSYIDPSQIENAKVYAGTTPVSLGGDSLGGTIVVNSKSPKFAAPGQGTLSEGQIGAFYRSNGNAQGANLSATLATENLSLSYSGATAKSHNYKAGGDFKTRYDTGVAGHTLALDEVGSTAYKTTNHLLGAAVKSGNHLFEAKIGVQDMPYQLYPNQRMDLLNNEQKSFNFRYAGNYDWGKVEARAYHEKVEHYMNFGADKQLMYGTAVGMPMYTKGKTTGASLHTSVDLSAAEILRLGAELQQYRLEDWWPASGTGGMSPLAFENIKNGKRDRTAVFGEWEKRFSPQWLTLFGARYEHVRTDADAVHGYDNPMMNMNQLVDKTAFNNAQRNKTDDNLDLTALAKYTVSATQDVEFGFARKVRSPNLYERYTWSTASMMMVMNNTVGDGNGYVGNVNLKSEKAHTVSATFDWHGVERDWEFKATPFYTHVTDYIGAVRCSTAGMGGCPATVANTNATEFTRLQYANQSARLYGIDLSGKMPLGKTAMGDIGVKGFISYTNGKNRDTGDNLYNVMPLNAKVSLTQKTSGWDNALELVGVSSKQDVSAVRNEIKTPGYGLVNLRLSHSWQQVRVDFGVENLFDKSYALPLGGAYTGQGTTMSRNVANMPWGIAVPGMGRSIYAGVNIKF